MTRLHLVQRLLAPLCTFAALACAGEDLVLPTDGTPSNGAPAQVEYIRGDDQVGPAGSPLPQDVVVQLVDPAGNGIPDESVTWEVGVGGGTTSPQTTRTDDQGFASATWTLGSPGPNSLDAVVSDVGRVTFTATANDDGIGTVPSATTSTVSADPASIQVQGGVSTIRVTVRDAAGAPVPGAVVTLSASGSGNTLTQPAAPAGADGVAVGNLSSSVAGTKDVMATVNGAVQITQTAQVFVAIAPATRIELFEGDDQNARSGDPVPVPPAVRVLDAAGRPVAGFGVTFVVTRGGGSVTGASQITNANGIARVGSWTLGSPGQNTLEARAGSLSGSPVVFEANASSPPPPPPTSTVHHFIFLEPPRDVDENEEFTVKVAMVDEDGNIVPRSGVEIYLGLFREGSDTPSNSRLSGDRFRDTENGVATFTLRVTDSDRYRFRALSDELPELGPYGPEPFLFSRLFEVD